MLESFLEYSLQQHCDVVVYPSYDAFRQSNIGLGMDWQNAGGLTNLINNKMVVYFDGNHGHLKKQLRQGIARVLVDNLLFGEDIGEVAGNQALLDLPKWLVDGYVAFAAEPWSTQLDNELKAEILSGKYTKFHQLAYNKPQLAGHAFWRYIAEKYKPTDVTYFIYLARLYKSLNMASNLICKKKLKKVLREFMEYEEIRFNKDNEKRKDDTKGSMVASADVSRYDQYRFQMNPNKRENSYAWVEFRRGVYRVKLDEGDGTIRTLLERGVRSHQGDYNPNYPILAWDTKGRKLLVIYWEKGKTKMFQWDIVEGGRQNKQEITGFDQILDASFMLDPNTVILSAVKNGHSDIFLYKIEENTVSQQITDDVYDDLNPSFVSFPGRSGIIFSSNRPETPARFDSDTALPSRNRFNIFLADIFNNTGSRQISRLTDLKLGDATLPTQYDISHFTFVSDENGIANRWAGFFSSRRNGLDTLYNIGEAMLRNPTPKELDSTLAAWNKDEPDSVHYYQAFLDTVSAFPLTNYPASILESRIAGNNGQVTELKKDGDEKVLYKLKVNEKLLRDRNVTAKPTAYRLSQIAASKEAGTNPVGPLPLDLPTGNEKAGAKETRPEMLFQTEFQEEKPDPVIAQLLDENKKSTQEGAYLSRSKLFNYRNHFNADNVLTGLTNNILVNRYQPYQGGSGPVQLNNGNYLNWSFKLGTSDLLEDLKFSGGIRFGFSSLKDKDVFFTFQNDKRMLNWGLTYYRSNSTNAASNNPNLTGVQQYDNTLYTNIYQVNLSYPLDEVRSFRLSYGLRVDRFTALGNDTYKLAVKDSLLKVGLAHLEYVHDNSLNLSQNIWDGIRYKIYLDVNTPIGLQGDKKKSFFNFGFDGRLYRSLYRNFIWAGRMAGDFSWGKQKIIYYLGGMDGWLGPKFIDNPPAQDRTYTYQSLAVNMRGYWQNIANGNNAVVMNSEFRLPVFSTFITKPINNAFIRNFQLVQFFDFGTAWNGLYNSGLERPSQIFRAASNNLVTTKLVTGGIGPFAGGYGFGARSSLLGYFVKTDVAWPMRGFFRGDPVWYFSLGFDF